MILDYNLDAEGGSLMGPKPQPEKLPACCDGEHILSCTEIDLDLTVIGDGDLYLEPLNTTLSFEGMVGDSTNAYHYGSEHVDFILTVHKEKGSVYGHAQLDDDSSYVIEFCGEDGHVLKELDVENLGENVGFNDVMEDEEQTTSASRVKRSAYIERAKRDTTTIVTYTVKVYYTPQFAASTSDIDGFIDQVIQETNQGYINSRVPLRVRAHCSEQATINDQNGSGILTAFRNMKGSTAALRGSADSAALLVNRFNYCGIGYLNTIGSGATVSVTLKSCALGYYSFGHEIGHNIALYHNREVASTNPTFSDGHGFLIAQGSASTGARTILAYSAAGHRTRINYYSNPNVIFSGTGTATGSSTSNNARVLTVQRFALAAVGDESTSCSVTTTTARTTTTTTSRPTVDCSIARTWRRTRYRYIGRMSQSSCQARCRVDSKCFAWVRNTRRQSCHMLEAYTTSTNSIYTAGPKFNERSCYLSKLPRRFYGVATDRYARRVTAANGGACQAACRSDRYCDRWNMYRTNCYMYRTYSRRIRGYISGMKY